MGKVKIKKNDIWIDMTPMSDVMVLLLTFFMLTSTFVKDEAVKVNTPGSVSEIKVPETDVLQILVDNEGRVFLGLDKPASMQAVLQDVAGQYGLKLNAKQEKTFMSLASFGANVNEMSDLLSMEQAKINGIQAKKGIPTDSIDGGMSQFQTWVKAADDAVPDLKISIKADQKTPYKVVKKVMSELADMDMNRYYLITQLKTQED
ncbi:biopolymer transporter ExbD [Prevotella sp. PCHR]|uniref:Biopolymer transporter ExbD n=1 Tax=Xylanibacter caecicola TaxID=2736294 RepID=A0ABX2AZV9_9BACT|nr:biopolymer transporter ExbD [Xylanibacter caecicola]NPE24804.1 biopolymer transporter ExbD [Xylanibacter caecicola]